MRYFELFNSKRDCREEIESELIGKTFLGDNRNISIGDIGAFCCLYDIMV